MRKLDKEHLKEIGSFFAWLGIILIFGLLFVASFIYLPIGMSYILNPLVHHMGITSIFVRWLIGAIGIIFIAGIIKIAPLFYYAFDWLFPRVDNKDTKENKE